MTWHAAYEPLIGKTLEGFALKPITGDLMNVVSDFSESIIWYSGAVRLGFVGCPDLTLTWASANDGDCFLAIGDDTSWLRFSLCDLPMGFEERWAGLGGTALTSLSIYRGSESRTGVGAVCHRFSNSRTLWVAVGRAGFEVVGEGDDLCVSLLPPAGIEALTLFETVGAAA